jgi:hypothetical protein
MLTAAYAGAREEKRLRHEPLVWSGEPCAAGTARTNCAVPGTAPPGLPWKKTGADAVRSRCSRPYYEKLNEF